jgi:hypothetical protein
MTTTVPKHTAVALRSSQYTRLKALLAVAMTAVVGLSVAVTLLAVRNGAGRSPDPLSLMTPADTRYAEAISSLSDAQLSAAFGTESSSSIRGHFVYPPAQRLSSGKYLYP